MAWARAGATAGGAIEAAAGTAISGMRVDPMGAAVEEGADGGGATALGGGAIAGAGFDANSWRTRFVTNSE